MTLKNERIFPQLIKYCSFPYPVTKFLINCLSKIKKVLKWRLMKVKTFVLSLFLRTMWFYVPLSTIVMPPVRMIGGILFLACLSVILSQNFNLGNLAITFEILTYEILNIATWYLACTCILWSCTFWVVKGQGHPLRSKVKQKSKRRNRGHCVSDKHISCSY